MRPLNLGVVLGCMTNKVLESPVTDPLSQTPCLVLHFLGWQQFLKIEIYLGKLGEMVREREAWHATVHGFTIMHSPEGPGFGLIFWKIGLSSSPLSYCKQRLLSETGHLRSPYLQAQGPRPTYKLPGSHDCRI